MGWVVGLEIKNLLVSQGQLLLKPFDLFALFGIHYRDRLDFIQLVLFQLISKAINFLL